MKVIKETDKETAREYYILKMEGTTKDSGKTIKCMVLVNSITRTAQSPMKDIGKTTNLTGKDVFTTCNR